MNDRYFLAEAKNISWHLIPESRREEWFELVQRWDRHERVYDDIVAAFAYCQIPGSPSNWHFADPVNVCNDDASDDEEPASQAG